MNKKAVSMAFIMAAVIILLLAVGLLFFIKTVFLKTGQATIEEKCRISVEREAMLNMLLGAEKAGAGHTANDFATNVECQEIPVDLKGKDEKTIAGMAGVLMEKCWNTFGKGKLELFSRGSGTFCSTCYVLDIDPKQTIDLEDSLASRQGWVLEGRYDVPQPLVGGKQGIVFFYQRDSAGTVASKIYVRPLGALDMCRDAVFPRRRLA